MSIWKAQGLSKMHEAHELSPHKLGIDVSIAILRISYLRCLGSQILQI